MGDQWHQVWREFKASQASELPAAKDPLAEAREASLAAARSFSAGLAAEKQTAKQKKRLRQKQKRNKRRGNPNLEFLSGDHPPAKQPSTLQQPPGPLSL